MGMADLVPGVSGGTMAFILGIYERLLHAIKSFDHLWLKALLRLDLPRVIARPHFAFLIPLLIGITCALLFFTQVISLPGLLHSHPELIYGLFFGLIVASIVVLMLEVQRYGITEIALTAAGVWLGFLIVSVVPVETPETAWFVFLSGAVAICAMILPGISGSFILLILHKYAYIIGALGDLRFSVLIPFALGCVTGLIAFTRFLLWMLSRFYQPTLLIIKGVLIASLWVIWPFQARRFELIAGKERLIATAPQWPAEWSATVFGAAALMLAGFAAVMLIHYLANPRRRAARG